MQSSDQVSKELQIKSGNVVSVGNVSQEIPEVQDIQVQLLLYRDESLIDISRSPELFDLGAMDFSNHQTLREITNEINLTLSKAYSNCRFTKINAGGTVIPIESGMLDQPIKYITKSIQFQIEAQIE